MLHVNLDLTRVIINIKPMKYAICSVLTILTITGCAPVPTRIETHAVQAGKMVPGDSEAAFKLVNTIRDSESVVLIYDASGSMRWPIRNGGEGRYGAAFGALQQFIDRLSKRDQVAIIVYGSTLPSGIAEGKLTNPARAKASCNDDIRIVSPLGRLNNHAEIKTTTAYLNKIDAYRGDTPIGGALNKAADLLSEVSGSKRVVLLTDGVEECYPLVAGSLNPEDSVKRLTAQDVTIDVVFAGGGLNAQGALTNRSSSAADSLRKLATGQFFEAASFDDLVDALLRIEISKFRYELIGKDGRVTTRARIGEAITVPSGEYVFHGLTSHGFKKTIQLPNAPASRIFLALSREGDTMPDIVVLPDHR